MYGKIKEIEVEMALDVTFNNTWEISGQKYN